MAGLAEKDRTQVGYQARRNIRIRRRRFGPTLPKTPTSVSCGSTRWLLLLPQRGALPFFFQNSCIHSFGCSFHLKATGFAKTFHVPLVVLPSRSRSGKRCHALGGKIYVELAVAGKCFLFSCRPHLRVIDYQFSIRSVSVCCSTKAAKGFLFVARRETQETFSKNPFV